MNGKGDRYRPYDPENFGREYDRIFKNQSIEDKNEEDDSDRFSQSDF